jgi:hypothetical protein
VSGTLRNDTGLVLKDVNVAAWSVYPYVDGGKQFIPQLAPYEVGTYRITLGPFYYQDTEPSRNVTVVAQGVVPP